MNANETDNDNLFYVLVANLFMAFDKTPPYFSRPFVGIAKRNIDKTGGGSVLIKDACGILYC